MKIEAYNSGGKIRFTVSAESAMERAVVEVFLSHANGKDKVLGIGGHTYSCDVSGVTDFNFGWIDGRPAP